MSYSFVIKGKLPNLNDYTKECRTNRYSGAKLKDRTERFIALFLRPGEKISGPVHISFEWTEADRRRDLDNVAFAKKFILDCLVRRGILENDSPKYVRGFTDTFRYVKGTYQVKVTIEELNNEQRTS